MKTPEEHFETHGAQYSKLTSTVTDKLEIKCICDLLNPILTNKRIIDLGAGSGQLTKELLKSPSNYSMDLLEPTNLIEKTKYILDERIKNRFHCSYYSIPVTNGSYDLAVANFSLPYAKDLSCALNEINRAIKSGGYLIFSSVWARSPPKNAESDIIHGTLKNGNISMPVYAYWRSIDQTISTLNSSNFGIEHISEFSPDYYIPDPYVTKETDVKTYVIKAKKRELKEVKDELSNTNYIMDYWNKHILIFWIMVCTKI